MRAITPASVMAQRSPTVRPVVEVTSWLGARFLGEITVMGGSATTDLTLIGGELEVQVPNIPEWVPTSPAHPLAAYGQELLVRKGWASPDGTVSEWATIGRYLISRAVPEGEAINVRADGLGQRIENDRPVNPLTAPYGPMLAQARAVLAGTGIPVVAGPGLDQSRLSRTRTWERATSRVEIWAELMTAWPASSVLDPDARAVVVRPPLSTAGAPVVTLTDGVGGSVVAVAPGGGPEDGAPNGVAASTAPEDGSVPITAVATLLTGPRRWSGPYGRRPQFYASPLLTTWEHVSKAAQTRLNSLQATTWDLTVDGLSCPAIESGDLIRVVSEGDSTDVVGQVIQSRVALSAGDEPGQVSVQALRGRLGGVAL